MHAHGQAGQEVERRRAVHHAAAPARSEPAIQQLDRKAGAEGPEAGPGAGGGLQVQQGQHQRGEQRHHAAHRHRPLRLGPVAPHVRQEAAGGRPGQRHAGEVAQAQALHQAGDAQVDHHGDVQRTGPLQLGGVVVVAQPREPQERGTLHRTAPRTLGAAVPQKHRPQGGVDGRAVGVPRVQHARGTAALGKLVLIARVDAMIFSTV